MSRFWLAQMVLALSLTLAGYLLPSLSQVLVLAQLFECVFGLLSRLERTLVLLKIAEKKAGQIRVS
jgi:hypothetical protein